MEEALNSIKTAIAGLSKLVDDGTLISSSIISESKDGVSLLSLKNHALLSYLHNLALIIASHVERSRTSKDASNYKDIDEIRQKAIEGTITQRVTLEKGVKGLESKISYQLEKVLRANIKAQKMAEESINNKAKPKKTSADDNSDSDDDVLNYRPNPNALVGAKEETDISSSTTEKYKVPKISAVTPFAKDHSARASRKQRNTVMDEYIQQASEIPAAEPSIGSTIMDSGRGGERTERDLKKEKQIQSYEEENYTRLPGLSKKQAKKAARQRQRNAQENSWRRLGIFKFKF